jgi:integrase
MKVNGNGQGKVLTQQELRQLFTEGLVTPRDRALFAICLFTGCRVSEALALQTTDIKGGTLTFRKSTTKGKLKTRVVDIQPGLASLLEPYQPSKPGFLFPGFLMCLTKMPEGLNLGGLINFLFLALKKPYPLLFISGRFLLLFWVFALHPIILQERTR